MRISDWSSDVCSSDLDPFRSGGAGGAQPLGKRGRNRDESVRGAKCETFAQPQHLPRDEAPLRSSVVLAMVGDDDAPAEHPRRSAESRVGQEWVSTGSFRWSPVLLTKHNEHATL